jgi:hypothetical protein
MHETDSNRAAYIKQLYGRDWCDVDEYDLIVNTGRVSYETAAQMILCGVRDRSLARHRPGTPIGGPFSPRRAAAVRPTGPVRSG